MSDLRKMIRCEFKDTYKRNLICIGGLFFSFALISILILLSNANFFETILGVVLAAIVYFMIIIMIFASSIGLICSIFQSLNRKLFSTEGYLTFSLPVTTDSIILSKVIVNFIWILLEFASLFAGVFLIMFVVSIKDLTDVLEFIYISINLTDISAWEIIAFISNAFIAIVSICISILFVLTVLAFYNSGVFKKKRGFVAVILYILASEVLSTILILISQFCAVGIAYSSKYGKYIFDVGYNMYDEYYVINFTSLIIYSAVLVGLYFLVRNLLKKKIELVQ